MSKNPIWRIFVIALTLFGGIFFLPLEVKAEGAPVTSLVVREKAGVTTENYPLTFGHVFKKGDVPNSVSVQLGGKALHTQVDIKTRYPDGSLRHAVISVLLPKITANQDLSLTLINSLDAAIGEGMSKAAILESDVGAYINLSGLSDSGYSGNLTADLRAAIENSAKLKYWLKGNVCTEILVGQRLNESLNATWEVRLYPGTPYARISHAIENVEANYRGNIDYTVSILQRSDSPIQVYGPKTITHLKNSRWRKYYWLGQAPPEIEIHYDINYLISTGHILPYNVSLEISEETISDQAAVWASRDTDLYGITNSGGANYAGFANTYFPSTGGRPEIGILPKWTVLYLLTWDNRLREITFRQAELMANAPMHWREYDPKKTFYGRIINIDDRPKVRIDSEKYVTDSNYDPLPPAIGSTDTSPWSIDRSHQGSFAYIPYLLSGEYFYLQEMLYWAGWNLAASHWDPSWGRNSSEGLIRDQIRGVAWAIRNIADAAAVTPNEFPEKAYFEEKIVSNINYRESVSVKYALRNMSKNEGEPSGVDSTVEKTTSPWMEDFFLISLVHLKDLGYDTGDIIDDYSSFVINRFSNPEFNWYNGANYRFPTETIDGEVTTWKQASGLYSTQKTSFPNPDAPDSYRFIALAALGQVTNKPKARMAYEWLKSHVHSLEMLASDPTWAINARGPAPTKLRQTQ